MLSTYHTSRRTLHTTLVRLLRVKRQANPGADHHAKALDPSATEQLARDPEGFGELESDFMEVHRTQRQHEQEIQQHREMVRRHMVARKYFREPKLPQLLTYAEKEQMRLLNARDPEEWTVERLAESFPATPQIVQKVLEAKWRPRSAKRIREHDEAVIRNWERLRAGANMELPSELSEHLKKFAERKREDLLQTPAEDWIARPELPQPKGHEFSSIITSCSRYAEPMTTPAQKQIKAEANSTPPLPPTDPEAETYLLDKVRDKRQMRLQELKQLKLAPNEIAAAAVKEKEDIAAATPGSLEQRAAASFGGNPAGTGVLTTHTPHKDLGYAQKFQSNEIVISAEDRQKFEMSRIKDRIHIPRKVWRQGATYRVEDCYYDDDGEFLYRVPGMSGGGRGD